MTIIIRRIILCIILGYGSFFFSFLDNPKYHTAIDNKENTINVTAKTIVAVLISSELLFSTLASTSLKSGALVFLIEVLISSSNFSPDSVCSAKKMKSSEKLSKTIDQCIYLITNNFLFCICSIGEKEKSYKSCIHTKH